MADKLRMITEDDYNAIHTDYRGVYSSDEIHGTNYNGRRTMLDYNDGETTLLIEGEHFEIIENPTEEQKFNYMLLSRLQADCEYYLGNGRIYGDHLWAGNVKDQIAKMKELHNGFADNRKPEWLTMEQIEEYEVKMLNRDK